MCSTTRRISVLIFVLAATALAQTAASQAKPRVRLNRVIERLEQGQVVIGTFPGSGGSLSTARTLATSSNDFVMFDLQYGLFDVRQVQLMLFGMIDKSNLLERGNLQPRVTPLARIPESTHDSPEFAVKQLLDAGVFGIMFPHIESKEQAEAAVRSMRYPQRNGVSFDEADSKRGAPKDASWYWGLSDAEYKQRADVWPINPQGELLAIAQIESSAGVAHLDDIARVPGIGAILIGPYHLSESLGEKSYNSPKTEANVQIILKKCLENRIPCAYPVVGATPEESQRELARRRAEGFRIITVNTSGR
jgi:4-hydroxy-2-oxoheptanedioate aldolase